MSDTHSGPNFHEIIHLSNVELAKRTKTALDKFMQSIKEGGNVAEKVQLYNAYQDERLNRLNVKKITVHGSMKRPSKNC